MWLTAAVVASLLTGPPSDPDQTITYTAASGQANRLTVTTPGTDVRLTDPAGLTAQAPCTAVDARTVSCPRQGWLILDVALGDGDDVLFVNSYVVQKVVADGGEGNDALSSDSDGFLQGGPGDDTLSGSATLLGGPGADRFVSGSSISYADHTAGVEADLGGDEHAGAPGEGDRIAPGFRDVQGGDGPDVLRAGPGRSFIQGGGGDDTLIGGPHGDALDGGDGDDTIRGAGGADTLFGKAGDDRLDGGPGRDTIQGQAGTDVLLARDGAVDNVECEDGPPAHDRATVDPLDTAFNCASVDRSGPARMELLGLTPAGSHALRALVSCPAHARHACVGAIHIGGQTLRVRVPPGRRARPRVRLARPHRSVTARLTTTDARGRRIVVYAELDGLR
jgi:hypothetical protein